MAVSRGDCDLPDDIIFYILLRIPVKSLIRFKTVSKSWNALITNPYFIRQHHSQQPSSKLLWMTEDGKRIYPTPITFDTTSNSVCFLVNEAYKPIVPAYVSGRDVVWILGHCFGVFCFLVDNMDKPFTITLGNLATGETKEVPLNRQVRNNFGKVRYNFGFGCVVDSSSVPEFKIVSLEFVSGGFKCLSSHVYTSTTNTWKSVEPPCGSIITLEQYETTELNGVFHWMAKTPTGDQFILTFDLKKELFGRIEIPADETFAGAILTKQDDKYLSLISHSKGAINIWVMHDYKSACVKQARVVHDNNNGMISWCWRHGVARLLTEVDTKTTELFDYVESLVSFKF